MKVVVSADQRRYFEEHGVIEFEDFISQEKLDAVNREIDRVLSLRTGAKSSHLPKLPPQEIYPYARNLWMDSEVVKKFECQSRFSETAYGLFDKKEFLLGYDQLIVPENVIYDSYYKAAFKEPLPLEQVSSLQGIAAGIIVCLGGGGAGLFPKRAGSISFIHPRTAVNFSEGSGKHLLVVFAKPSAVYLYQEKDPNTHFNKQKGYVFGDSLFKKGHPLIRVR